MKFVIMFIVFFTVTASEFASATVSEVITADGNSLLQNCKKVGVSAEDAKKDTINATYGMLCWTYIRGVINGVDALSYFDAWIKKGGNTAPTPKEIKVGSPICMPEGILPIQIVHVVVNFLEEQQPEELRETPPAVSVLNALIRKYSCAGYLNKKYK